MAQYVLGVGASHNGGAALLRDGELLVAIQEERLKRTKRARLFPAFDSLAIEYCLDAAGVSAADLDLLAVSCDEPVSRADFDLRRNPTLAKCRAPLEYVGHHRAHAASAAYQSGWSDGAVLVIDGLGSPWEDLAPDEQAVASCRGWETMSIYPLRDGDLLGCVRKDLVPDRSWMTRRAVGMPLFAGIGGMYSAVSQQLFGQYLEAGKVMGLAPWGEPTYPVDEFLTIDGETIAFHDTVPLRFGHDGRWPDHADDYKNLAASVQAALETAVIWAADLARTLTGENRLVFTGGVALNCITNERLIRERGFDDVFVMPAAEDSGLALGAAVAASQNHCAPRASTRITSDACGRLYDRGAITAAVEACSPVVDHAQPTSTADVATALTRGLRVGWFHGPSELGPRALGQRSILCDPRDAATQDDLNDRKGRERFRPLAPVVMAEHAADWFDMGDEPLSPFMLRVTPILARRRGEIPAVAHVDGTARVQTVEKHAQPELHALLSAFYAATGVPILVNTSFNAGGEPIVETPEDAIWCAYMLGLDMVVAGDLAVSLAEHVRVDALAHVADHRWVRDCAHPGGQREVEARTPWGPTRYWLTEGEAALLETIAKKPQSMADLTDRQVAESLRRKRLIQIVARSARSNHRARQSAAVMAWIPRPA